MPLLQKAFYEQRMAQYQAQMNSFDAKIQQTQATIDKLKNDEGRYRQRDDIAKQVEDMRTLLAEHGTGSLLNKLISQDQQIEMLRTLENDHNSLIESEHTLASLQADREAFKQQWFSALSQDLVTARNTLDTAKAQLEKATKHQDLVRLTATEDLVVLTPGQALGRIGAEGRRCAVHADADGYAAGSGIADRLTRRRFSASRRSLHVEDRRV